ncbi:hypothetical protein CFOL_v3_23881, partial [Cephalotus follicularis]
TSFVGPLSTSSESEEESDTLPSPLASFSLSLLFSLCKPFTVASTALEPLDSNAAVPDEAGVSEEVIGAPGSCNFFFIKSSADDDPGTPEVLRAVASRPPVLTAGALKLMGEDPFSVNTLVFGTEIGCSFDTSSSCFFLNSATSVGICQLLNCLRGIVERQRVIISSCNYILSSICFKIIIEHQ